MYQKRRIPQSGGVPFSFPLYQPQKGLPQTNTHTHTICHHGLQRELRIFCRQPFGDEMSFAWSSALATRMVGFEEALQRRSEPLGRVGALGFSPNPERVSMDIRLAKWRAKLSAHLWPSHVPCGFLHSNCFLSISTSTPF